MRNKILASITALLALGCLSVGAQEYANPTLKSIYERTSVRSYTTQEVSKELLMELVKAGMAAPSAMNKQPWEFVVVQDRDILNKLGTIKPPVSRAPAAIVVLGNTQLSGSWMLDCSAVTQNILLAATSMGVGTVWTGAYGNVKFEALIKETLGLPDGVAPLSVIAVGYANGATTPKDKFVESKVHFNRY